MKKLLTLFSFIFVLGLVHGQSSNISGTVVDPLGNVWTNAVVTAIWQPSPGVPGPYTQNGNSFNSKPPAVTTDGNGHFSISLSNNDSIAPSGSYWSLSVCPNATASCAVNNITVTNDLDVSSLVNSSITNTRINALAVPMAYSDSMLNSTPRNSGAAYYDVKLQCFKIFNGISFACSAGGLNWPNTTISSVGGIQQNITLPPQATIYGATSVFNLHNLTTYWDEMGCERLGQSCEENEVAYNNYHFGLGYNEGSPWSIAHAWFLNEVKLRAGIDQGQLCTLFNGAAGDAACYYAYLTSHSNSRDSSGEGSETLAAQVKFQGGFFGTLVNSTPASPTNIVYNSTGGQPGGDMYLIRETGAQSVYVNSVTQHTNSSGQYPWSQTLFVSGYTGPQSTAMGIVTATSNNNPSSVPQPRTLTVAINPNVNNGAGFNTNSMVCISGGEIDNGSVSSVGAVSNGVQTVVINSPRKMFAPVELWQGGPCGTGFVETNGNSLSTTLATHDFTMMPIVGSIAPGSIMVSSAFKGGQQGPGYGFVKRDFKTGLDPSGYDAVNFSILTPGTYQLNSTAGDLTKLETPTTPNVTIKLVTNSASWNAVQPYHDANTPVPFGRLLGQSGGTNFSSNLIYQFFGGGTPTGTAVGHVEYTGFDSGAIVSIAEIAAVSKPNTNSDGSLGSTFPITLRINSLPAMAAGEVLDEPNGWWEVGNPMRLYAAMINSNALKQEHQDITGPYVACVIIGDCLTLITGHDSANPSNSGLNIYGYHSTGINVTQAQNSYLRPGIPATIHESCPPAGCFNNGNSSTHYPLSAETQNGGPNGWGFILNSSTGEFNLFNDFLNNILMAVKPGNINPYTSGDFTQTTATDGSQSLLMPQVLNLKRTCFMNPFNKVIFTSCIGAIQTYYNDPVGRTGIFPVSENTGNGGVFSGRLDAGQYNSTNSSTFNGIYSGVFPPEPVDTTVSGHTGFVVTPSSGATCQYLSGNPNHCIYRQYKFSVLTATGESIVGPDFNNVLSLAFNQNAWGPGVSNVVTVPNYAQVPGVTAYCVYYSGNTDGSRRLGCLGFGGSLTDDGSQNIANPGGGFNPPAFNASMPIFAAQAQLFGHGLRMGIFPGFPLDIGLSRTGAGNMCVDGTVEGDCKGYLQSASLSTGQASAVGTTCTIGGYITLTIDGVARKLAYCQ